MRVVLPGGVRVDWSPDEAADAIRILTQALLSAATGRESGLILANPQVVRYDDRHVRLTPTEFALLRFAIARGSHDYDTVKEAVWLKKVSDKRVGNACRELSDKLAEAGIPFEVSGENSSVSLIDRRNPGNPGQIRDSDS